MEFNPTTDDNPTETTNYEGGTAYDPETPEMHLYQIVVNNLLEDTFYREDGEALGEVITWFGRVADENPAFPVQLAAHAQGEMGLRDISNLLVVLAANDERTREYVRTPLVSTVFTRPDDVTTAVAMHDTMFDRSLPQSLRAAINDALHKWDHYQFSKYDTSRREVNLRDVLNRTHPKPRDDEHDEIFERLMRGPMDAEEHAHIDPLDTPETWETTLSEMGNTAEAWREVLPSMGLFAKIRNVRNMLEAGVEGDEIFGDEDMGHVRNSRFFPFRFYQSYRAYQNARGLRSTTVERWLSDAVDETARNVPDELENTLVAVDVSKSMRHALSERSDMTYAEIATFFGAVLRQNDADVVAFGTDVEHIDTHTDTPTLEVAERIKGKMSHIGGGTNAFKVFDEWILGQNAVPNYDRVVFLTDGQVWDSTRLGGGREFRAAWDEYTEYVETDPSLYIMDLASYSDLTMPEGHPNVFRVGGWTSRILDFMVEAENPGEAIEAIQNGYTVDDE